MDTGKGLPSAGPICDLVVEMLSAPRENGSLSAGPAEEAARLAALVEDPLGDDDLQLALYLCFELHYRSFPNVDPAWEWDPTLLAVRALLEQAFFDALEAELAPGGAGRPDARSATCSFASSPKTMASRSRATSRSRPGSRNSASSSSTAPSTS